jgi:hypothetical protein
MFETLDAVAAGHFFWDQLLKLNAPPFNPVVSSQTGYCFGAEAKHVLIVANNELHGQAMRINVMLRDVDSEEAALEVELDSTLQFFQGKVWGKPSDEIGAVSLLSDVVGFFSGSKWQLVGAESIDELDALR